MGNSLDKLEWTPIEVGEMAEVERLAEAVRASEKPLLLERNGKRLAVLVPVELAEDFGVRGPITEEDREAFEAAAGSWRGLVDADRLIEDIYARRGRPVEESVKGSLASN